MMSIRSLFASVLLIFTLIPTELSAQETSVDLEYRFNPTYSRGFRRPLYSSEEAGFFGLQRTRLILNFNNQDSLKARVIFQDRRVWGETNERADVAELAIFRAWIEKKFSTNFSLRLGRQGLIYDDQHLFGELNWGGTLAHDLALGKFETDKFKVHAGLAFNANRINELTREPYQPNFYKNMQFLWFHKDWKNTSSSFYIVNRGLEDADTTILYTQTFGTNTTFKINSGLALTGVYYHQIGRNINGRDVNANFLSLKLSYQATDNLKLALGLDKVSGTDLRKLNDPNAKSSTFDILYGLRHARFGYLDYFYLLFDPVFGLRDYYLRVDHSMTSDFSIRNLIHLFTTDASTYAPGDFTFSNPLEPFIGIENDLLITYKWSEDFKGSFGHSIMFESATLEEIFGGNPPRDTQFFYIVLTASPRIFEKKKD